MKVLLGLSGGLDSSYAAYYLKEQGHSVTGVCLVMHDYTDISAAERSAYECGIDFTALDCREKFAEKVIEPFMDAYMAGKTPNPCVLCNPSVKIGMLCDYAVENRFDRVATGHYCSAENADGRFCIKRGADEKKDQSYMLWGLSQTQLSLLMFPLCDQSKENIRENARSLGLSSANSRESQEICFIPDGDYASYIEKRRGTLPEGNFISPEGQICGRHRGILHYTVGQRKHLGIALGRPVFIKKIDSATGDIYLADSGDEFTDSFSVSSLNLQLQKESCTEIRCNVRQRYSAPPSPCRVALCSGTAYVRCDAPIRAVTPGQSAVFYDDEGRILFGGEID